MQFKIGKMTPSGYDVAYGTQYFAFPNAPNPVEAAVQAMQVICQKNKVLPITLVKSMDDPALQRSVIQRWTQLVKNGTTHQLPPDARAAANDHRALRDTEPMQKVVTRAEAMEWLEKRMRNIYESSRNAELMSKSGPNAAGEGHVSRNDIKGLNLTYTRIMIMDREAREQGIDPEVYFQRHSMYKPLCKDILSSKGE